MHYVGDHRDPNKTNTRCLIKRPHKFHRYLLVWTPHRIRISYDGKTCLVNRWRPQGQRRPAPFDKPFVINLTQALGIYTNAFNPARTPLPARMQVDYVRVWK